MCFGGDKDDTPAPRPAAQAAQASPRNSQSGSIRSRTSRKSEKKRQENEKQAHENHNGEASSSAPPAAHPVSPPPADAGNGYAPPAGPPPAQFSAPTSPPPGHQQPASPAAPPPAQQDTGEWYAPPPGPPPGWAGETSYGAPPGPPQGQYDAPAGPPPGTYNAPPGPPPARYDAPAGPPPGQFNAPPGPPPAQFDAPSGPPPGERSLSNEQHAPPPGPPPGVDGGFAPPSGPPPAQFDAPAGPPPGHSYEPPSGPPPAEGFSAPQGPPPGQAPPSFDAPAGPPPGVAYTAPTGPPPGFSAPDGPPPAATRSVENGEKSFAPPAGPPPPSAFAPPPGPPPSDGYGPPPGPPPAEYAPPSGPPPPEGEKSQHNWQQVIPDTALFPPPPAFFTSHVRSHTSNATDEEADAGNAWCQQNPILPPAPLPPQAFHALQTHNINLMQPQVYHGTLVPREPGVWEGRTEPNSRDSCIIGFPPLYSAVAHSPLATGQTFKIYYEVYIRPDSKVEEVDLALGFTALPYPSFRMPGWHRGSLAVHGDDGHKYINDQWGGKDFTEPFVVGQTYGIGMAFSARENGTINVDIFFTREGKLAGSWNLHEESDANEDLPVFGLEGFNDLTCAIGTFDRNSFEIIFDPAKWKYQP